MKRAVTCGPSGGATMRRAVARRPSRGARGQRLCTALALVPALVLLGWLFPPPESATAQARPRVTDIEFLTAPNSGDTFRLGEKIRVLVTFDRDVTVDRVSLVQLDIGSRRGIAWYLAGIGGLRVFEYIVSAGDMDSDGVSIRANAISGTIVDAADGTTSADLTHDAVPDDPSRKVTGTRPDPGVTVWPRNPSVPEGDAASYLVALDAVPRSSVTVSVAPAPGSDPDLTATPTRLTFTASNWNTAQTVTLSAAEDQDGVDGTAIFRHSATSADPGYQGVEIADVTATENDDEFAHFIPFFPSGSHDVPGFARIINRSKTAGEVYIFGIDDEGMRHGPSTLSLPALGSRHFSSQQLEDGAGGKGLTGGLGDGTGMWRLELATDLRILPLAYIRTPDGFVTAMQGVAESSPVEGSTAHYVPFFNPGSNERQVSRLRITNPGADEVAIAIEGIDDEGKDGDAPVRLVLDGGETRAVTAQELESGGGGLSGGLGDGAGKWRLDVRADAPVEVMNLLESPTGHLANLSATGLRSAEGDEGGRLLPLFPAAGQQPGGFARIINHSARAGRATIYGIDDQGKTHGPITLALGKREAVHFTSRELESGNPDKGLSGGLGNGEGNWRLLISSGLDVEALAYIRTSDGFVTTMYEVVRETAIGQHVPFFNPASNTKQVSRLRLVNPTDSRVRVTISGRDDEGESPSGRSVHLSLAPGEAHSISARDLESGGSGLRGSLGDGVGKWQLFVSSDASIEVASLLESPTGHLANLSASAGEVAVADPILPPTGVETIVIDGERIDAAADQVVVILEEDVTRKEFFDLQARLQELAIDSAFDSDLRMLQLIVDSDADEVEIIEELRTRAGVATATPNSLVEFDEPPTLDNEFGHRHFLERSGGFPPAGPDLSRLDVPLPSDVGFPGRYWIDTIRATPAWDALSGETLHDNAIAVVDSGLPTSQDVLSESRVSRFDEQGNAMSEDDTPDHTHGRWVAAFAAGYRTTPERRGANPHSRLVVVDVRRPGTSSSERKCKDGTSSCTYLVELAKGIEAAVKEDAQVVNVSIGDGSKCSDAQSRRLDSRRNFRNYYAGAMHYAREKDVLVVWSAGNNCEKRDDALLPSGTDAAVADSWRSHALIVAASDEENRDRCSSRMGEVVSLAAPGDAVGWGSGTGSGTSYAAPLVTGAAGLVRAVNDTLSAPEAREILIRSADVPLTPRTTEENRAVAHSGCRSFPESESTWSATTPRGILNLDTAVQTALLTKGIELETVANTILSKGSTATVEVDVELPASGVSALDIVFLIDQSGSYSDDIDTLQAQAGRIVDDLNARGIDVRFGVAGFADFPISPYGSSTDTAYRLYQRLTADVGLVKIGIERLDHPLMHGSDGPESQLEALFQVATGLGRDINGDGDFSDTGDVPPSTIGWREGALPVVMLATDAVFHDRATEPDYPGPTKEETIRRLKERGLIVFGLQSGRSSGARRDIQEITDATGGEAFELDGASSTIADTIAAALTGALSSLDVSLEAIAGEDWITSTVPAVQTGEPGETLTFTVHLRGLRETSIRDLAYHVYLWARADGRAVLKRVAIPICVGRCR